jgi:hypothetical protein
MNFTREQRLDRSGTAANVDEIRVQAMFAKKTFFMSQPKRANAG